MTEETYSANLFRAVNTLLDACGQGQGRAALDPTIKFLLNYVDKHFTHEEQLQAKSNYPGMPAHKQFHESYKSAAPAGNCKQDFDFREAA